MKKNIISISDFFDILFSIFAKMNFPKIALAVVQIIARDPRTRTTNLGL